MATRTPDEERYGLWGPTGPVSTQGVIVRAPRKRHAWGMLDVLWTFLAILGSQMLILPILALIAIQKYNVELDSIDVAEQLTEKLELVALTGAGVILAMIAQWAAFIGVPLYATYRKGHRSLAKDFGLVFKWTDVPFGFLLALGLQALMAGISWLLNQTSLDLTGADNTSMVTDNHGAMLIVMIFGAVVMAPLTEELLFRGLILRGFLRGLAKVDLAPPLPGVTDHLAEAEVSKRRRVIGVVLSVLFTSLYFGLLHFSPTTEGSSVTVTAGAWVVVAQTGLLGVVFALVALKTRRLGLVILMHFFFNSASIAAVTLTS